MADPTIADALRIVREAQQRADLADGRWDSPEHPSERRRAVSTIERALTSAEKELVCAGGTATRRDCGRKLHVERRWDRDPNTAIRCLDCGSMLCPDCAKEHFAESDKRRREIADAAKRDGGVGPK